MDFLYYAVPFEARLMSDYPEVVQVADHLFDEIKHHTEISNEYRSKEALKVILANLLVAARSGLACRYSRDKNYYSANERYGLLFFKYNRMLQAIDTLQHLEYIEQKHGIHYDEIKLQSRMWPTAKLLRLFHENQTQNIEHFQKQPPTEIVQLRARRKGGAHLLPYEETPTTENRRANLQRYNQFMEDQLVECHLDGSVEVNPKFLRTRRGNVLTGRISITGFNTDSDRIIRVRDEDIHGYELGGMMFAVADRINQEQQDTARIPTEITPRTINQYFIHYINHTFPNQHPSQQQSNTKQQQNFPMTQAFSEIYKQYQSSNAKKTTTMRKNDTKRPLSEYGIRQLNFSLNYKCLHCVFVEEIGIGGRFYGAVQLDLPKEVRSHIRINGSPCVELDYSAHHIRLLYNERMNTPYDLEDPYADLCRDNPDERPIFKKILLIAINAENEKKSIKAIRKELYDDGIRGHYLTDDFIKNALDRFKEHHKTIAGFLNLGVGLDLQFTDSRIAEIIIMRMIREGIPCLPVHDSFIVPEQHAELLREVMVFAYKQIAGEAFKPVIK